MITLQHFRPLTPTGKRKKLKLPKATKTSRATELWYTGQLLAMVGTISRETREALIPVLQSVEREYLGDAQVQDDFGAAIAQLFNNLAKRFGGLTDFARNLAGLAARRSLDAADDKLAKELKQSVSIDIGPVLKATSIAGPLQAATLHNAELITSIPTQYLERVRTTVFEAARTGLRHEEVAKKLQDIEGVTRNRAKLIARDQTAKMQSSFNRIRQQSLGITKYTWQTAGDERVRPEHAANNGKVFSWSDPPDTGNPGDEIQCRCTGIPYFDLDAEERALGL